MVDYTLPSGNMSVVEEVGKKDKPMWDLDIDDEDSSGNNSEVF